MPIQQKLPPPVLLFSDFAGWDLIVRKYKYLMGINVKLGKAIIKGTLAGIKQKTVIKINTWTHLNKAKAGALSSEYNVPNIEYN